ncbi:MAG: hypothetical protein J0L92_16275 [Deltaproteobacteria bacterium]|nr:hypothetical protein [Deltaproteobacteria bacterium]
MTLTLVGGAALAACVLVTGAAAFALFESHRTAYPEGAVVMSETRWCQDEMPYDFTYEADVRMPEPEFHRWAREQGLRQVSASTYEADGPERSGHRATFDRGTVHVTVWSL